MIPRALEAKALHEAGVSYMSLALRYDVAYDTVRRWCNPAAAEMNRAHTRAYKASLRRGTDPSSSPAARAGEEKP